MLTFPTKLLRMANPATLSKSEIARLYNTDIRVLHRVLHAKEKEFAYWFTHAKTFIPAQYVPILSYLENECGFDRAYSLEELRPVR